MTEANLDDASPLDQLRSGDADRWPNIKAAKLLSETKTQQLVELTKDLLPRDEGALVVFGSLARGEFTEGSDLDWTVLIDGRADSQHLQVVHALRAKLEAADFQVPGPTEIFGGLVISHDLIHAIGGNEDTNNNMTRRLLLLLESASVGESVSVHNRVVKGVLYRYVQEDASFLAANKRRDKIPRFLLNDVVRFWRTMAVDYANKYRARAGDKWALRNIKLRMSRKLLFVSGFLMCISWAMQERGDATDQDLVQFLHEWAQRQPLESIALVIKKHAPDLTDQVFDNYDAFLGILSDTEKRKHLAKLTPEEAYDDDLFLDARRIATSFDEALTILLFTADETISALTRKYGVF